MAVKKRRTSKITHVVNAGGIAKIAEWLPQFIPNKNIGVNWEAYTFLNNNHRYGIPVNKQQKANNVYLLFVDAFYFVDAVHSIGTEPKILANGEYSITSTMLNKLTIDNIPDSLKDYLFDDTLADIDVENQNLGPILDTHHKAGHKLKSVDLFLSLVKNKNVGGIKWMMDHFSTTYGIRLLPIIQDYLAEKNFDEAEAILDLAIDHHIFENTMWFRFNPSIPKSFLGKLAPFISLTIESVISILTHIGNYYAVDPSLIDMMPFSDSDWQKLARAIISDDDMFGVDMDCINHMVTLSTDFEAALLDRNDKNSYLTHNPEIMNVFLF